MEKEQLRPLGNLHKPAGNRAHRPRRDRRKPDQRKTSVMSCEGKQASEDGAGTSPPSHLQNNQAAAKANVPPLGISFTVLPFPGLTSL